MCESARVHVLPSLKFGAPRPLQASESRGREDQSIDRVPALTHRHRDASCLRQGQGFPLCVPSLTTLVLHQAMARIRASSHAAALRWMPQWAACCPRPATSPMFRYIVIGRVTQVTAKVVQMPEHPATPRSGCSSRIVCTQHLTLPGSPRG